MSIEKIFGYDYVDGKYVINKQEAEIVKFITDRFDYYSENPPQDIVEAVYEENKEFDDKYTMEQAYEAAKHNYRILYRVIDETNTEFGKIEVSFDKNVGQYLTGQYCGKCELVKGKEIISPSEFIFVQAKMHKIDTIKCK